MLNWVLCAFSLSFIGLGLLTFFRAPTLFTWKLAIVGGEFGHWFAAGALLFAIVLGALVGMGRTGGLNVLTLFGFTLAFILLANPMVRSWWISRTLPGELKLAFGTASASELPFSFTRLWTGGSAHRVPSRTLVFSEDHGQKLSMDFYPASSGKSAPCVIAIHGGGWDGGDRTQLPGINELLALRGYAVATIDYRLAPAAVWPAQREDTLAALRYLQAHALELNIDGQRFVLLGRSAGGQIAVTTAYEAHEPAICGVVSLYGPHDMLFAWQCGKENDVLNSMLLLKQYLGGTPQTAPSNFESASSYFQVDKSVPPTLLMHGEIDTLVWNKQSERLASRLAENGVPHHFMSLPWGVHAFDFNLNGPSGQLTTYTLEYFLSAVTK